MKAYPVTVLFPRGGFGLLQQIPLSPRLPPKPTLSDQHQRAIADYLDEHNGSRNTLNNESLRKCLTKCQTARSTPRSGSHAQ